MTVLAPRKDTTKPRRLYRVCGVLGANNANLVAVPETLACFRGSSGGGGGIRTPGPRLNRPFISSEVQSASLARLQFFEHENVSK